MRYPYPTVGVFINKEKLFKKVGVLCLFLSLFFLVFSCYTFCNDFLKRFQHHQETYSRLFKNIAPVCHGEGIPVSIWSLKTMRTKDVSILYVSQDVLHPRQYWAVYSLINPSLYLRAHVTDQATYLS